LTLDWYAGYLRSTYSHRKTYGGKKVTMKTSAKFAATVLMVCSAVPGFAQQKPATPPATTAPASAPAGALVTPPSDYVVGAGDVLAISYYKEKDMTNDYIVRPDGKITLPLLNDLDAQGLTTDQLRERLTKESTKYFVDPNITVGVRTINSRKVYISGGVLRAGAYDLNVPLDVYSLIALAGGLKEYANGKNIIIVRTERGRQTSLRFNYKDFSAGKNLDSNIPLRPGDKVVVPE
jgi:polysaccharide biosynthesis/export protein